MLRHGLTTGGRRFASRSLFFVGLVLLLAGCQSGPPQSRAQGPITETTSGPKVLRMGMIVRFQPKDGVVSFSGAGSTGVTEYMHVFHSGLTVYDPQSNLIPRLAQRVPTLDNGDWTVFADGQMQVTWKLKPNLKWHDGVPATAADFAFGLKVVEDAEFPFTRGDAARLISQFTAP